MSDDYGSAEGANEPRSRKRPAGYVSVRQPVVVAAIFVSLVILGGLLVLLVTRVGVTMAAAPNATAGDQPAHLAPADPRALQTRENPSMALPATATRAPQSQAVVEPTLSPELLYDPQVPSEAGAATSTVPPQPAPASALQGDVASGTPPPLQSARTTQAADSLVVPLDDDRTQQQSAPAGSGPLHFTATAIPQEDDVASTYVLRRGEIIPATLVTSIDSTIPGAVVAQVSYPVYDAQHRVVLIPAGARLLGADIVGVRSGQRRVMVTFDAIQLPDSRTVSLQTMPGVDLTGTAGFGASVDRYSREMWRNVALLSVLGAAAALPYRPNAACNSFGNCAPSVGQMIGNAIGAQIVNAGTQAYQSDAQIQPTLHVVEGAQVAVMVTHDIPMNPWSGDGR